jgi:hypothetical protein
MHLLTPEVFWSAISTQYFPIFKCRQDEQIFENVKKCAEKVNGDFEVIN